MSQNPITVGQNLINNYREKIQFVLQNNHLDTKSIQQILKSIEIDSGIYLSLNPRYKESEEPFANFVQRKQLPERLISLFPKFSEKGLYAHQDQGINSILNGKHTIVSTGTGSGKTETFLIPIIAHCLKSRIQGVKAIIIYPMNALAGDQVDRIGKYTQDTKITFSLYTGATPENTAIEKIERRYTNQLIYRNEIRANPPDILITNYVMLDRMLTREQDHRIFIESAETLQYVILDELHIYTGSKATHLKYLLARLSHYWQNQPVYIGTSATLTGDEAGKKRLDTYIQELFNIEANNYTFIEAIKDPLKPVKGSFHPLINDEMLDRIEFSTDDAAAKSIGLLTGQNIDPYDFYSPPEKFHETPVFQSVLHNQYVHVIYEALEDSSQSYSDLLKHISRSMSSDQIQATSPEKILLAYLKAISYVNEKAGDRGKHILDYRIHIFLQNLTGTLKACPNCHRFYGGDLDHCTYDGDALFSVYQKDIRYYIGKFNGQELTSTLVPESTDQDLVHYVLIGDASDTLPDSFDLSGNLLPNGRFELSDNGKYKLAHLNVHNYEQLELDLIQIGDEKRDYLYLVHLVKTLLQNYNKSLGFVDNRELASRYSSIIRDEFASEFLFAFLELNYPRPFDIDKTLTYLQKCTESIVKTDLEQDIFDEIPIWFYRMIGVPERMGGQKDLLQLKQDTFDWSNLSELQQELLELFIRERAIDAKLSGEIEITHYIRFQKYWATSYYGIFIEDTVSNDPFYRGVSLSNRSRSYVEFVERWTSPAIQQAVEELVEIGILSKKITSDSKVIYHIKPEYLCFNLSPSSYGEGEDGYSKMKKSLLFRAEAHSSDIQNSEREKVELRLKNGIINFVIATPTLEMGIDIGDLETVLMIGAPPNPASYAQRAGRAGRGTKKDALIVTFCSPSSPHDVYAFRNPPTIINGHVAPPSFNARNPEIAKQHINAFLLRKHLTNRDALRQVVQDSNSVFESQMSYIKNVFGDWFDYQSYQNEFALITHQILRETEGKRISLAQYCYATGIFPDYSFRRDQIIAVDIENRDNLEDEDTLGWKDYALTTRDTEQAFRFFVPGQTVYVAGDIYKTLNDGIYDTLPDGSRQYACFYAEREVLFAQQRKEIKRHDLRQHFTPTILNLTKISGILAIGHTNDCLISFRNHGIRRPKQGTSTSEVQIPFGYDLKRDAFVLRFDTTVCDETMQNSLIAMLIREINKRYGLAEGEIQVMLDAKLFEDPENSCWQYSLFYDNDGNGNLPLRDIIKDFEALITSAYNLLVTCNCETDGCYNCIRSYNTQYFDGTLSKSQATMFIGYLLNKNKFSPTIEQFVSKSFDLVLNIQQKNNEIIVTSSTGNSYHHPVQDVLNDAIFITLELALYSEYQPHLKSLKIETWVNWLANAINHRSVNKGKAAFNRFQFALLRFNRVEATHNTVKRKATI